MFENLKRWMQRRFEERVIKSELDSETVYLAKGVVSKEWKQVYPLIDEKGKWNRLNLIIGGWKNLVKLLVIMLFLIIVYFQISNMLGDSKEFMDGSKYVIVPRDVFMKYCNSQISGYNTENINFSNYLKAINISVGNE